MIEKCVSGELLSDKPLTAVGYQDTQWKDEQPWSRVLAWSLITQLWYYTSSVSRGTSGTEQDILCIFLWPDNIQQALTLLIIINLALIDYPVYFIQMKYSGIKIEYLIMILLLVIWNKHKSSINDSNF